MFLEIDKLSKRFGATAALDAVSLMVAEGEFICFLGPSGCGKTTLLRCIAGLERHDAGTLRQRGADISAQPPAARDFGIVFQSYALFPNLTVEKNIGYGLTGRRWGRAARDDRVADMLSLVGLDGEQGKYPAQLSGGQQQRVALARALAPRPSMLLLDEPLSALDAKVRERLRREVKDLQRHLGVTTIMVTHDQEEALTMADRIVVMDAGRVAQIGTPSEIYERPVDAFVADFVGTMNLLSVQCEADGALRIGECWRVRPTHALPHAAGGAAGLACCVRPRHLTLARQTVGEVPDACAARVVTVEYLGAHYRVSVRPDGCGELLLRVDLTPEQLTALAPVHDERLTLQLPPDALHFFPAESTAAQRMPGGMPQGADSGVVASPHA
jgi:iron(III) transport system ATP-binding protein